MQFHLYEWSICEIRAPTSPRRFFIHSVPYFIHLSPKNGTADVRILYIYLV